MIVSIKTLVTGQAKWSISTHVFPDLGILCRLYGKRCRSSGVEHVLGKDGVGGSIPLGSTSLRKCSARRLPRRSPTGEAGPCPALASAWQAVCFSSLNVFIVSLQETVS
jgi:hypothetical protein